MILGTSRTSVLRVDVVGLLPWLAAFLVVLSGALCVFMPFWGDQALFTLYARALTEGAVLYRDLFDVKQPGIFLFYAAAGLLLGFTEVGIHLFEIAYWLAFSTFAIVALRPYFTTAWGPPLVPVFTVCVYYWFAGLLDLGQVEILVGFPLLVAWWLIDRERPGGHDRIRRYAAAGVAAAAVVLLKHLYLLIVLAFLAYATVRNRRSGVGMAELGRAMAAFLVALAIPLIVTLAYFAAHAQLGRVWWAYLEMAPAAQLFAPRPFEYLVTGVRRFTIGHAPLLILSVLACVRIGRDRPQVHLVMGMLLWGAAGVIAFPVLQGWPEYKWPLFTVPVGILATVGAEVLARAWRTMSPALSMGGVVAAVSAGVVSFAAGTAMGPEMQTRLLVSVLAGGIAAARVGGAGAQRLRRPVALIVLAVALGAAAGLLAIAPVGKVYHLARHDYALRERSRTEFQRSLNRGYADADADLARLRSTGGEILPGAIYVFGDPIVYLRAGRSQAVPILGWGPEFLDARAWSELHRDLRSATPPYIVVTAYAAAIIGARCPAILEFLSSHYTVAFEGASGTWYERR